MLSPIVPIIGIVAVAAVLILISFGLALNPPPVPSPDSYMVYTSDDRVFSVNEPVGGNWSMSTSTGISDPSDGLGRTETVQFKSGTAMIIITQGTVTPTDSRGKQSKGASDVLNHVFDQNLHRAQDRVSNFRKSQKITIDTDGFGEGLSVQYFGDGPKFGVGGAIKGYYVALVSSNKAIVVICECRSTDWQILGGVFRGILATFKDVGHQAAPSSAGNSAAPAETPANTVPDGTF
ncbi:MAG: hypothetical protein ACLQVD_11580 [Capsulimonadaceae bacterium]